MPPKIDPSSLLGEPTAGRRLRRRSLSEAARALVGDDRSQRERLLDEFEQRLFAALRSLHRTHGTPR
jgi:hypothetical protein